MRACDRCHRIKERCSRSSETDTCGRCSRLKLKCCTTRLQRKIGRKPTFARHVSYQSLSTISQPERTSNLLSNDDHDYTRYDGQICEGTDAQYVAVPESVERRAAVTITTEQEDHLLFLAIGDKSSAARYVIGPSFHEIHQRSLIRGLKTAPSVLKDAFISCAALIASGRGIEVPAHVQEQCQKRAAIGVSVLRAIKINDRQGVSSCLLLGVILMTFAKYIAEGEVLAICRWTLSQIKPFYEAREILDNEDDGWAVRNLVLTETIECLFQAEVPVLRLECGQDDTVDRFLGFSSPLLTHLHSLANLNHKFRNNSCDKIHLPLLEELHELESTIASWMPIELDSLNHHFEQNEIIYMLKQAKIMRETMLLVIHRLEHPYGSGSTRANELFHSICDQLELLKTQTGKTLNIAGLSLMTTSFELDCSLAQKEALGKFERLTNLSPRFQNRLQSSLLRFWSAKQHHGHDLRWSDVSRYYTSPLSEIPTS